jgi:hypothetical protein
MKMTVTRRRRMAFCQLNKCCFLLYIVTDPADFSNVRYKDINEIPKYLCILPTVGIICFNHPFLRIFPSTLTVFFLFILIISEYGQPISIFSEYGQPISIFSEYGQPILYLWTLMVTTKYQQALSHMNREFSKTFNWG